MNLERMKADAAQVVDGVRTPRQQQARDVLSLVGEVEAMRAAAVRYEAAIDELRKDADKPFDFVDAIFGERK